ncbi:MAG: RagB/SusD family nutrient uptake outer membrane protein [Bacteroides sp.]|jgi:hypothetical protein|nr:RagB/SusD family nutrient uptake outer membrane protein [Bacteroides sp.]MCI1682087.1 RagB/SusD family nutrient uptake outer membrane protein [Bacteroides sp.]
MKTNLFPIKTLALCAMVSWMATGCDDFLNTTERGVTSQEDFYKTDAEAEQAVFAIYDMLQSENLSTFEYKNILSDDAQAGGGGRSDNSDGNELNEFDIAASNGVLKNMYTKYYEMIYCANIVIQKVTPDTETKTLCVAEAKCLRAYAYFELVTLWGTVPLVTEPLEAGNYNQPNSTVDALYAQIEQDLKDAIDVLPLKSKQSAANKARVSKGTAQALLGKAYLFERKYADAATEFDLLINTHEYDLYPDYSQITRKASEFGIESVFEISYSDDLKEVLESTCIVAYCGPRSGYFTAGSTGLSETGWGFVSPEKGLREAFIEAGDEVRQKATVLNEEDLAQYGASIRASDGSIPYGCDGLVRTKYGAYVDEIAESNESYHTIAGTNFRIIRYADVLLMAAEAYNRQPNPDDTKAQKYLNEVRLRVGLSDVEDTGDALFEAIKKERRLELAFESVRFQDLVRWGEAEATLKDAGKKTSLGTYENGVEQFYTNPNAGFKSYNVLMPFPDTEMSVNPYIKQNTGY